MLYRSCLIMTMMMMNKGRKYFPHRSYSSYKQRGTTQSLAQRQRGKHWVCGKHIIKPIQGKEAIKMHQQKDISGRIEASQLPLILFHLAFSTLSSTAATLYSTTTGVNFLPHIFRIQPRKKAILSTFLPSWHLIRSKNPLYSLPFSTPVTTTLESTRICS